MKLLAALVMLLPSCLLKAPTTSDNAPKQPPLATLTAHLEKTVYKGGESIQVTLTLRAGLQEHMYRTGVSSLRTISKIPW